MYVIFAAGRAWWLQLVVTVEATRALERDPGVASAMLGLSGGDAWSKEDAGIRSMIQTNTAKPQIAL